MKVMLRQGGYDDVSYYSIVPLDDVPEWNNRGWSWGGYKEIELPDELVERYKKAVREFHAAADAIEVRIDQ